MSYKGTDCSKPFDRGQIFRAAIFELLTPSLIDPRPNSISLPAPDSSHQRKGFALIHQINDLSPSAREVMRFVLKDGHTEQAKKVAELFYQWCRPNEAQAAIDDDLEIDNTEMISCSPGKDLVNLMYPLVEGNAPAFNGYKSSDLKEILGRPLSREALEVRRALVGSLITTPEFLQAFEGLFAGPLYLYESLLRPLSYHVRGDGDEAELEVRRYVDRTDLQQSNIVAAFNSLAAGLEDLFPDGSPLVNRWAQQIRELATILSAPERLSLETLFYERPWLAPFKKRESAKSELEELRYVVGQLHYCVTLARMAIVQHWTKVEELSPGEQAAGIELRADNCINQLLIASGLEQEEVTPQSFTLNQQSPIQVIVGQNGEGKSQYMAQLGFLLWAITNTGHGPGSSIKANAIFDVGFISTAGQSKRGGSGALGGEIDELNWQLLGMDRAPQPGVVRVRLIDEPFRGARAKSRAYGVATLFWRLASCARTYGMFTAHLSGLSECVDSLPAPMKFNYKQLAPVVSPGGLRYRIVPVDGEVASSGIEVAQMEGLPREICNRALWYRDGGVGPSGVQNSESGAGSESEEKTFSGADFLNESVIAHTAAQLGFVSYPLDAPLFVPWIHPFRRDGTFQLGEDGDIDLPSASATLPAMLKYSQLYSSDLHEARWLEQLLSSISRDPARRAMITELSTNENLRQEMSNAFSELIREITIEIGGRGRIRRVGALWLSWGLWDDQRQSMKGERGVRTVIEILSGSQSFKEFAAALRKELVRAAEFSGSVLTFGECFESRGIKLHSCNLIIRSYLNGRSARVQERLRKYVSEGPMPTRRDLLRALRVESRLFAYLVDPQRCGHLSDLAQSIRQRFEEAKELYASDKSEEGQRSRGDALIRIINAVEAVPLLLSEFEDAAAKHRENYRKLAADLTGPDNVGSKVEPLWRRLVELDLLLALANKVARGELVYSKVGESSSEVSIIGAKSLALLSLGGTVRPYNVRLGAGTATLIEGPNRSGKTHLLETIIGCAHLSTSGNPIPAESASLPEYEMVIAHTETALHGSDGSAFQRRMRELARSMEALQSLNSPTTNSHRAIIGIDEIGSETSVRDGAALSLAIMDFCRERNIDLVFSSHLTDALSELAAARGVELDTVLRRINTVGDGALGGAAEFCDPELSNTIKTGGMFGFVQLANLIGRLPSRALELLFSI